MKKIPTLFERKFDNGIVVGITDRITPGCKEAFLHGIATIKYDGSCCAVINGEFYKRFDAKPGRKIPAGAIPCCDPDPVTGHWPHWVKVTGDPSDKWFLMAYGRTMVESNEVPLHDGTYEAIGPHFQGNPYDLDGDKLIKHGIFVANVERTFSGVKSWLENNYAEGLVFWLNGEPVCKIKRSDFGIKWR